MQDKLETRLANATLPSLIALDRGYRSGAHPRRGAARRDEGGGGCGTSQTLIVAVVRD
jgi:hypothetical protein